MSYRKDCYPSGHHYEYQITEREGLKRAVYRERYLGQKYIEETQSERNRNRASEARKGGRFMTAVLALAYPEGL
jgi:hypothetical protein